MDDMTTYAPAPVWVWDEADAPVSASGNRPDAGARHEKVLPVGKHPIQLYSRGTPNGVKVTILLEEMLALGISEVEYDAWMIDIGAGDQFGSGFVELNPNSKIPAALDRSTTPPTRIFESAAIMLYLAEKHGAFLPSDPAKRAECLSWLFWQMGSAPFLGGGFGHFYDKAPVKIEYAINRFAMEAKRLFDVLNRHLADKRYVCGDEYTIADIAIWAWYGQLVFGRMYNAAEFLGLDAYEHVGRWAREIDARPAVQRGIMVNKGSGDPSRQLRERHDASDFENRTQDKLEAAGASTS